MNRVRILAFGVALSAASALSVWAAANDETVGEKMEDAAKSTGHAIKEGAEATGHAVKEGAEATGHVVKEGAEAAGHAVKEGAEAAGHAVQKGAEKTGEFLGITATEQARYEANERAQHRMYGQVTGIDHQSGVVEVKTAATELQLQFPPDTIEGLKTGDEITVDMAYALADGETTTKAYDAPKQPAWPGTAFENEHWMRGVVQQVDRDRGVVNFKTDKGRALTLHFPPSGIATLNAGDHIAVEMGFGKGHIEKVPPTEG